MGRLLVVLENDVPGSGIASDLLLEDDNVYCLQTLGNYISNTVLAKDVIIIAEDVPASGSVVFSSFVQNDTVTLNGQALTGVATPSGATQFTLGSSDDGTASNFADFVNSYASSPILHAYEATPDAKTVTLVAGVPGLLGNAMTLAISAHGSVSAARLASAKEAKSVEVKI